jgi:hypothetical protein
MLIDLTQSRNDQNIFEAYLDNNPNIHLGIDFAAKELGFVQGTDFQKFTAAIIILSQCVIWMKY